MRSEKTPQLQDPLVTTVNTIGDSYAFLIIREAFFGATKFGDFVARLKISRARLTERLKHLVASEIFEKRTYTKTLGRHEYRLTKKGLSLYQVALALHEWGDAWRPQQKRTILLHRSCGTLVAQKTVCCCCKQEVRHEDIIWPSSPLLIAPGFNINHVKGWRRTGLLTNVYDRVGSAAKTLEVVGDRWSILIMYLALHGPFRFKDAKGSLGVSDTILSKRLKHLVQQNLLVQKKISGYQTYLATRAGIALLPAVLAQRMWAVEWETHSENQWSMLRHSTCGNVLKTKCICTTCEQAVFPGEVDIQMAG